MPHGIIGRQDNVCTNATVQDVRLDVWEHSEHIRWKQVSGIDETSAATLCQVGWSRGEQFFPFRGGNLAALGRSIRLFGDVCLPGEYVPTARFYGATLGDTLILTAAGEIERL